MSYEQSLKIIEKQSTSLKQTQRMMMSPQMQQGLKLLQAPIMEISQLIEEEIEQNPLLDYSDGYTEEEVIRAEEIAEAKEEIEDTFENQDLQFEKENYEIIEYLIEDLGDSFFQNESYLLKRNDEEDKLKFYLDNNIHIKPSIYSVLLSQAREVFEDPQKYEAAEAIIYSLDDKGFFTTNLKELAAATKIPIQLLQETLVQVQLFDPAGIAASSLKESLLMQLKKMHKTETLAYKIIEKCYDELIHNKLSAIASICHCSLHQVDEAIKNSISKLDLNPAGSITKSLVQPIVPDLYIFADENGDLKVRVRDDEVPQLKLNLNYLKMLKNEDVPLETKEFIKKKFVSAKWLINNIFQRNDTLARMGRLFIETQADFFSKSEGKLVPMTMKTYAEMLEVHESTVARAVANKYLACEKGLYPLRYFFTSALNCDDGNDISSESVKELICKFIEEENKMHPLSDETLSRLLKKRGITCARRTVAKYRMQLNLGNAHQRKKYI